MILPLKCLILVLCCTFITVSARDCAQDEFQCREDSTCIKIGFVCDGSKDCPDNSDEEHCDLKFCKKPNWYMCANNKTCINSEFLCDGLQNCPDGDDELNCGKGEYFKKPPCGKYEFTCSSDKNCVPLDFVCDGKNDCLDGSDETLGCVGIEAKCKGFVCDNKKCLESASWICDGHDDCGDRSDERGCVRNCDLEEKLFLCHDNDSCISIQKVCDGKKNCHDGSDEGGKCDDKTLECKPKCPGECVILPDGAKCLCDSGYYYNKTENTCLDIDECQKFGICSQKCKNSQGSYECSCAEKFTLKNDGKSCEVQSGEPLLLYTTQKTIVGIYLKSRHMYVVASNRSQVIGVAYDGLNIYWSDIKHQAERIVRAREDGSKEEILLTSGLESPEDLAIDWLTGNIYFTDNILKHIAVCTNNGFYCLILVIKDVDQPRGIVLNPLIGTMYWTDWGLRPMIGSATMNGHMNAPLVKTDIHWPNGLALDLHNDRIYWADAKLGTIESVHLNGKDRQKVLSDILKHPYGLALFEDRLYWSDWGTKSIHSCDKFTGKNHEVIARDRVSYDVHIFHSAIQPKANHSCMNHKCSHLCLLGANNSHSCACPNGMLLGVDQLKCKQNVKNQMLYIGLGNYLLKIQHSSFGRHKVNEGIPLPLFIHKMAFNSLSGTLFIADNSQRIIYEVDPYTKSQKELVSKNLGNVTALSYDYLADNLYWTDSERHTIELISLKNKKRVIVHHFSGNELPIALLVVPDAGKMFIVLRSAQHTHIDMQSLNGRGDHNHIVEERLGNRGFHMAVEESSETVFWLDNSAGKIEFTNYEGSFRHLFRIQIRSPVSMAVLDDDVVWSIYGSRSIFFTHRSNLGSIKSFELEKPPYISFPDEINLVSTTPLHVVDHICQRTNGGCSHICVSRGKGSYSCMCPPGYSFNDKFNTTCTESSDCGFRCKSGECLIASKRCNGVKDCADNSDEEDCNSKEISNSRRICSIDQFSCHDGKQCIYQELRCDHNYDCADKSDEEGCEHFDHKTKCHKYQFACENGQCTDLTAMCDGVNDCLDGSDESICKGSDKNAKNCGEDMFKCNSGQCISKYWECDGRLDCIDGSDEHNKCVEKECKKGFTKCKLGHCIDKKLVCDGHNDCGDNSDEDNCDKKKITCSDELDDFGQPKKFQCPSNLTMCLDILVRCNGTAECPRGEDEVDCDGCSIHEYECETTKECIRKEFRCDNEKDCSDGSDEVNCGQTNSTYNHMFATMCQDGMFDCKDGTCIDQLRVCDGIQDCAKGNDETEKCTTSCQSNHPCEQKCNKSPYGPVCSCNEGYRLNGNKKTCSDINECEEGNPCAQICVNNYGSYRCSCYPGFMLRTDKESCKSINSEHFLLFTTHNEIRKVSENPTTLEVLWSSNDSRITGLDVNIRTKTAYFTIQDSGALFEYNLVNGTVKVISNIGNPQKVAVDWVTNNIYFIDETSKYSIKVCSFAGKPSCVHFGKARPRDIIKAIAVDAVNKYLFYSVMHTWAFDEPHSIVYRVGLDRSRPEILVSDASYITSLECDNYKQILYYVDFHTKTLSSVPYSGGKPKIIVKKDTSISKPTGLCIYENTAFIVNTGSPEAGKCSLYGERRCKAFSLNVYNAEDLVIVAETRQRFVKNVCDGHECSLVCVQADRGAKCLCHNGLHAQPGEKCEKTDVIDDEVDIRLLTDINASSADWDDSESSSNVAMAVCFTIIALVSVGLIGYVFYRKKHGHKTFNISMHFQNPLARGNNGNDDGDSPNGSVKIIMPGEQPPAASSRPNDPYFSFGNKRTAPAPVPTNQNADNESNREIGNFDDDPRARLVL